MNGKTVKGEGGFEACFSAASGLVMGMKVLPHYPNLENILDSIPDLKADQIMRIIELLYTNATDEVRAKVDMEVEIDCRDNRIESYIQDDQMFKRQVKADLKDWMDRTDDQRSFECSFNPRYDDIFCPDHEEYLVTDQYRLADLVLKLLWDAKAAAKRHDWPMAGYLIDTVYIEMEKYVKLYGNYRGRENIVEILQTYFWNEPFADRMVREIVMEAFLDPSLTTDKKTDLMLEFVVTGNIRANSLSWIAAQNKAISYPAEFLETYLTKALNSKRFARGGKETVFEDVLEFCDPDFSRSLVFKYGELAPGIFQTYFMVVRETLTPEQVIEFADFALPRIPDLLSKIVIKAARSGAKERLGQSDDPEESD